MILLLCITLILSLSHRIYWWVRIFETSLYPIYTFIHLAPIVPYVPTQCVCPCITITWICLGKLIKFSFFQLSSQFLTNQHCDWWSIRSYLRHEIVEYKRDWPGQLQLLHQCGIQVLLGGQQSSDQWFKLGPEIFKRTSNPCGLGIHEIYLAPGLLLLRPLLAPNHSTRRTKSQEKEQQQWYSDPVSRGVGGGV